MRVPEHYKMHVSVGNLHESPYAYTPIIKVGENIVNVNTVAKFIEEGTFNQLLYYVPLFNEIRASLENVNQLAIIEEAIARVAANLAPIEQVALHLSGLTELSRSSAQLLLLLAQSDKLIYLTNKLPMLSSINEHISAIHTINTNLPVIKSISDNLHNLTKTNDSLEQFVNNSRLSKQTIPPANRKVPAWLINFKEGTVLEIPEWHALEGSTVSFSVLDVNASLDPLFYNEGLVLTDKSLSAWFSLKDNNLTIGDGLKVSSMNQTKEGNVQHYTFVLKSPITVTKVGVNIGARLFNLNLNSVLDKRCYKLYQVTTKQPVSPTIVNELEI